MLRTVNFYGPIKDIVGISSIDLDVNSPRELFSALRSQVKNFRKVLSNYPDMKILYSNADNSVVEGIETESFYFPLSDKAEHIHLAPVIEGAGTGAEIWFIDWAMVEAAAITVAINVAISVAVSYVASSLATSPDTSGGNSADARPSFLFNGAVNVIEQGYPVPLVYGIHTTGSVVVSVGVDITELPYATATSTTITSPPAPDYQWTGGN